MYPSQNSSNNVEVCVSIQWTNLDFHVSKEHHYGCKILEGRPYLLHLSSVYGIKCLGEIYKQ